MLARIIQLCTAFTCILCWNSAWSQSNNNCASDAIYENLMENDPIFQRSTMYLNHRLRNMDNELADREDEIFTIPVVVHIINEGEPIGTGSNISDTQILSAIAAINEDFRKIPGTNGDGIGVDVGIEFCLASRDPSGNATNGIVRVDGSGVPNYADMGIQATGSVGADELAVKSLSTWPREDYMNIWVVNEIEDNNAGSGIQGYAYFPINSPLDGIVMLHNAFGTVGNLKPNTDMNRTLTHEIGHYIGLYHTFYNTTTCNPEANCETGGDHVCDTPITPLNPSCTSPACTGTQQVENYMDYTSETCRNTFTNGQKIRMRGTLLSDRGTLLNSFGCVPVSALDGGISALQYPIGSICDATFSPTIILTNYGSNTLNSIEFSYGVDGNLNHTDSWSGTLNPGSSVEITLGTITASAGLHSLDIASNLPNGLPDENTGNDFWTSNFTIASGASILLVVSVDFFGQENTWDIKDDLGNLVASGGPFVNNSQGTVIEQSICVDNGCYVFTMYDDYGDGMSFLNGTYELTGSDGTVLASGGGDFGASASHNFCVEAIIPVGNAPTANFNMDANSLCEGQGMGFTDNSTDSPTTYSWDIQGGIPSSSTDPNPQNISFPIAGTYTVTLVVSNDFGSDSLSQSITVNPTPTVNLSATNISCFGGADGSVLADATGSGNLTYVWNTGTNGISINGVDVGYYSVTVTDAVGCQVQASASLTQPEEIVVNLSVTPSTCFGSTDGSAAVAPTGGSGSWQYAWSNGGNTSSLNNLAAGDFSVAVTDANGCMATADFSVTEPNPLVLNLVDVDIACTATTGSASVTPVGGNGAYNVVWSTGDSGENIAGLLLGSYSVSVTDALGCSAITSFEISESQALTVVADVQNVSCQGQGDGVVQIAANGGSGNYIYSWSNGLSGNAANNLIPNTYTVDVVDDAGCSGFAEFTVTEPQALQVTIFKTDISCYGLNDGTATATPSGGTGDYVYDWSNGQHGSVLYNLSVGQLTVVVSDQKGCQASESIVIVEPSNLVLSDNVIQGESCNGSDGAGLINVMGGTPNYSYTWSNGANGQSGENLTAGVYDVVVSDANGCSSEISLEIPYDCATNSPSTTLTASDCGIQNMVLGASISCEPIPGAEMYQWKFENTAWGIFAEETTSGNVNSFPLEMVPNIEYGLSLSVSIRVLFEGVWSPYGTPCTVSLAPTAPPTQLSESDCGMQGLGVNDMIQTTPVVGANAFEWKFVSGSSEQVFSTYMDVLTITPDMELLPGTTYEVSVRYLVGSTWSEYGASCSVTTDNTNQVGDFQTDVQVSIYPNPGSGEKIIIEFGNLNSSTHVSDLELYNSTGKLIETFRLSNNWQSLSRTEHYFENNLSAGVYILKYTLNDRTLEEKLVVR